jgi:predicted DNA-binding protein
MATQASVEKETVQFKIPTKLHERLQQLSETTGQSLDVLIEEALIDLVSEYEDAFSAAERLKTGGKRILIEHLEKELGLDR